MESSRRGGSIMNRRHVLLLVLACSCALVSLGVYAQVSRPYHDGSVWSVAMIRMKPGMEAAYFEYLAGQWKANQEAAKKDGLIVSYKVLTTEGHDASDWNLLLMTEYKDLATMEANQSKEEALAQRLIGNDAKQQQGYRDREAIREVIGSRLAREIVLSPR
jgi:hypothetical protein